MFLTDDDYKVVVGDRALDVITQTDSTNRQTAEREAIEEISGYLRPTYDTDTIFAAEGDDRNAQIVMYAVDIAIYHLISWLPNKMGYEIRKERYDRAIAWLVQVAKGTVVPDLPIATDENGDDTTHYISFGGNKPSNMEW